MNYISAIAVDFGSTNSGCARICAFDEEGHLKYDTPHLMHSNGSYAKDNTWMYIEPSFYERIRDSYDSLSDEDFRIESPMMHTPNPNIIWGRKSIQENADKLTNEGWYSFKNFKMLLRDGYDDASLSFPLITIIKTFMRVLKIECLFFESREKGRSVSAEEIEWGVTIPSIWTDDNKRIMVDVSHEVFSPNARVLSEPEGPLVANLLLSSGTGKVEFQDGRVSLVIDLGGGTTDICLMQEVQQSDGSFKMEMLANTDGQAAGGNDVDKLFYIHFLRMISKGKKSDAGVAYDELSDDELMDEIFTGFQSNVIKFIEFEDSWLRLKSKRNLTYDATCEFIPTRNYRKWLEENGHKEVAAIVRDMLIDGCEIPSDEFRSKILDPVFDKICDKVREIINKSKEAGNTKFDNIILAGGMSLNHVLVDRIKQTIKELLGEEGVNRVRETAALFAGASIMTGACYMLVNRNFIKRLARLTYFYDAVSLSPLQSLVSQYKNLGIEMKIGEINNLFNEEHEAGYQVSSSEGDVILHPICIKGQLVTNYKKELYTSEGQTHVVIDFFSSDGKIVIFSNEDNPDLKSEGKIDIDCQEDTTYVLEVDFNEAQISNALHYLLSEAQSGQVVSEGFIENASMLN